MTLKEPLHAPKMKSVSTGRVVDGRVLHRAQTDHTMRIQRKAPFDHISLPSFGGNLQGGGLCSTARSDWHDFISNDETFFPGQNAPPS